MTQPGIEPRSPAVVGEHSNRYASEYLISFNCEQTDVHYSSESKVLQYFSNAGSRHIYHVTEAVQAVLTRFILSIVCT